MAIDVVVNQRHLQIQLKQLETVWHTVINGYNLSQAATVLHTSQSSLSKHIAALENQLKTEVFVRQGKRLTGLTTMGAALMPHIESIFAEIRTIENLSLDFNNPKDIVEALEKKEKQIQELSSKIAAFERAAAGAVKGDMIEAIATQGDYKTLVFRTGEISPDELKNIIFGIKNEHPNSMGIVGSLNNGKAMLTAFCGDTVLEKTEFKSGNLIKQVAKHIQGGGGGQPFYATAGGKNPDGIDAALAEAKEIIKGLV